MGGTFELCLKLARDASVYILWYLSVKGRRRRRFLIYLRSVMQDAIRTPLYEFFAPADVRKHVDVHAPVCILAG